MILDLENKLFKELDVNRLPPQYELDAAHPDLKMYYPDIPLHNDFVDNQPLTHWFLVRHWEREPLFELLASLKQLSKENKVVAASEIRHILGLNLMEENLLMLDSRDCFKRLGDGWLEAQIMRILLYVRFMFSCDYRLNHSSLLIRYSDRTIGYHQGEFVLRSENIEGYPSVRSRVRSPLHTLKKISEIPCDGNASIRKIVQYLTLHKPLTEKQQLFWGWAHAAKFGYRIGNNRKIERF